MKTLIRQATICYPDHEMNGKTVDIMLQDNTVLEINASINESADNVIKDDGLLVFPSLIDMQAQGGEPGQEFKEDFVSLTNAAHAGGFGAVAILPTTTPAIDNTSQVKNVIAGSHISSVSILPIGALSKGCQGQDLSEMFDLKGAGAIGFSDGKSAIADVNLMRRALEYAKGFDGLIMSYPYDERVNPGGMVNESASNTALGVKQSPALAEELMLARDIYLLEYTQSRLHVSTISTKGSIALVAAAKEKGLKITAGVAMHNLVYTENLLHAFDTNFKTQPPLRDEGTRLALIEAVYDGTIDVIVSNHTPENIEAKQREFDSAAYGITMLETMLPLANQSLDALQWQSFVKAACSNPRKILGFAQPTLAKGAPFDFTLFNPNQTWTYGHESCLSKSHNSPEFGKELRGRVINP